MLIRIIIFIIIIIIIIKERKEVGNARLGESDYTPYQSEDPSPTTATYRKKEEKSKVV